MNKPLLIKSIFMFFNIWAIGVILLWFRRNIEIFWKIIATVILGFYFMFFYDELMSGYTTFTADWYNLVITFLTELLTITFTNLFFLWPVVLVVIFYKADDIGAENLLKFMCILTLIIWVIFVIYLFYDKGINKFLFENLRNMIPGIKHTGP